LPLNLSAPYDSLAQVTQMTRTALADYIAGIQPNLAGTVNVNGTAVAWVSGNKFSYLMNGAPMVINAVSYQVTQVLSAISLIIVQSAGVQNGVAFSAQLPTGDIFSDNQAYVLPTVNLGWRKLQKKLADLGHPRMQNEVDVLSIPVITNLDPISQQYISWTQFFDGTNYLTPNTTPPGPVLPQDFISPLRIWERQTGMTVTFRPMHLAGDGLRSYVKGSYNRRWDWREDALYFPGSLLLMDMRVRSSSFLPDLAASAGGFTSTQVPIMRSADALAYYAAEAFVEPRGGLLAPSYAAKGDAACAQITNAWEKTQQRGSFHRQPWGGRRNLNRIAR
jgi:hypothetical protein